LLLLLLALLNPGIVIITHDLLQFRNQRADTSITTTTEHLLAM
jgi:hypothetical protein